MRGFRRFPLDAHHVSFVVLMTCDGELLRDDASLGVGSVRCTDRLLGSQQPPCKTPSERLFSNGMSTAGRVLLSSDEFQRRFSTLVIRRLCSVRH